MRRANFARRKIEQGPNRLVAKTVIHAVGGIVVRGRARPRVAIVQQSKDDCWVLPRGKLKRHERPRVAARREVTEETGHRVRVGELLGAIAYRAHGRPKVVQFWRMRAAAQPSREIADDIAAIEWLPLGAAISRLTYPLEKLFLRHVGRLAIPRRKPRPRRKVRSRRAKTRSRRARSKR
jgi:8-oxo-dGTP diphosphatase